MNDDALRQATLGQATLAALREKMAAIPSANRLHWKRKRHNRAEDMGYQRRHERVEQMRKEN